MCSYEQAVAILKDFIEHEDVSNFKGYDSYNDNFWTGDYNEEIYLVEDKAFLYFDGEISFVVIEGEISNVEIIGFTAFEYFNTQGETIKNYKNENC